MNLYQSDSFTHRLEIVFFLAVGITLAYCFFMLILWSGWMRTSYPAIKFTQTHHLKVSIIIAARNEAKNIKNLLADLRQQTYPSSLIEIIVVDDHSEDDTLQQVRFMNIRNVTTIRLSEFIERGDKTRSFKKRALDEGIRQSRGEFIITTDADCRVSRGWVKAYVEYYLTSGSVGIVAPLYFSGDNSFLQAFQQLDQMGLTVLGAGGIMLGMPILSNGGNMAFTREAWEAVNGYEAIDEQPSGDDILLMQKLHKRFPNQVNYLITDEARVSTEPMKDWDSFWNQRIRWTSKSNHYLVPANKIILGTSFIFYLSIVIVGVLAFLLRGEYALMFLSMLLAKVLLDFVIVTAGASFHHQLDRLIWFLPASLFHVFYSLRLGIGFPFDNYSWKGRTYNKDVTV